VRTKNLLLQKIKKKNTKTAVMTKKLRKRKSQLGQLQSPQKTENKRRKKKRTALMIE